MGKKILNAVGTVFAALLSLLLVVTLVAVPLVRGMSAALTPDIIATTVKEAIQNLDYRDLARENDAFAEFLDANSLTDDIVEDFMNTAAVEELIDCYIADLTAAVADPDAEPELDQDKLTRIMDRQLDKNFDEIEPIIVEALENQGLDPDKYDIREEAEQMVSEFGQGFLDSLPTAKQLGLTGEDADLPAVFADMDISERLPTLSKAVRLFTGGAVFWVLIGLAVILTVLILLCRFRRVGSLAWMTADWGIAAVLCLAVSASVGSVLEGLTEGMDSSLDLADSLEPALEALCAPFGTCAGVYGVIAGVALVAFVVLLVLSRRKKVQGGEVPVGAVKAPAAQPQQAAPTAQPQQAAPTAQPQQAAPTAQPQQAAPTAQPQQAAPTAQPQQAAPTAQPQQTAPAAQPQQTAPAEPDECPGYCPYCGTYYVVKGTFCAGCGQKL